MSYLRAEFILYIDTPVVFLQRFKPNINPASDIEIAFDLSLITFDEFANDFQFGIVHNNLSTLGFSKKHLTN
jgi:hypothetical protein